METSHANLRDNIYQFSAMDIEGNKRKMSDYSGKILLIVNVASKCGFTPQYKGLEELYQKYKNRGFVILGFPCNQFGKQEPGSEKEIKDFCELNFGVSFPLFSKIEVNGDNAHPLYKFLKDKLRGTLGTKSIKWNFTKFLVDKNGIPLKRFGSNEKPSSLASHIEKLL